MIPTIAEPNTSNPTAYPWSTADTPHNWVFIWTHLQTIKLTTRQHQNRYTYTTI